MTDKKNTAIVSTDAGLRDNTESSSEKPTSQRGGLLERAVTRLLMRLAHVTEVTRLSENFRLIHFQGEALKECAWSPGDKVQMKLDGGLTTRTYTPIEWDGKAGTTCILAYCHGAGPGSEWCKHAAIGDQRQFFGPRKSMDLTGLHSPIVFGDETSLGLALAMIRHGEPGAAPHFVFEVSDLDESASALDQLGLANAVLIKRRADNTHLHDISEAILSVAQRTSTFVLSGSAPSIQQVGRTLKSDGIEPRRIRTKVYWAPGKTGLD
jgi:ferric-chelate reductase (NADPH)